jgi:NAD(P)H-dependent flavin oxidoreductase YrpB (nitropropane dioxygenase family)
MTETEKSPAELFLELAKPMYDAAQEMSAADKETRSVDKRKRREKIAKLGFDYAVASGIDVGGLTGFSESNPDHYQAAQRAVQQFITERNQQSSNFLSSNLEGIVSTSDNKKLEKLLGDEEFVKFTPKEYKEWITHYAAVAKYREVAEKAKSGKLNKEEVELLIEPLAEAAAEKRKKAIKESGLTSDVQQTGADLARFIAHLGYTGGKEAIVAAAERSVKEREEKLRKYEKDKALNIHGYVTSIAKEMSKDPELFVQARDKLYSALTAKN